MILQSLNELYTRLAADPAYEIAPPGFSPQKVSFRVVLKADGSLFAVEDARIDGSPINPQVPQPEKRTSGVKSQFLCDKREYVLGMGASGPRIDCFENFKKKHLSWEKEINSPSYAVLCRFLEGWSPERYEEFNIPSDIFESFGAFQIQGEKAYVHDCPIIKKWWSGLSGSSDEESNHAQCLITGAVGETIGIHPDIKGFKSSVALVGIQSNSSYESYGKSKTENCPISKMAAFNYATALNSLLAGPQKKKHRTRLADTTVVHWTETQSEIEDSFAAIFGESSEKSTDAQDLTRLAQINRLLSAIKSGTHYNELGKPETPFYLLGLEQPNPGRFSIRFFHRSTIAYLLDKLHDHQQCLEIERFDQEPEFPTIRQLTNQIRVLHRSEENGTTKWKEGKEGSDKFISSIAGSLTRAIVEGINYPAGLYSGVIRRTIIERRVTHLRAAIIKAVLIRNYHQTISTMLNESNTDSAYRHGRLFAVIEKIQEEGHYAQSRRKLEHTIKEKYFSSACATPAAVFPRLETLSVHHQRLLNPGRRVQMERLIADIKWEIISTKKSHSLMDQGQFILGYYHQRKKLFTSNDDQESPEIEPATV
jgi:CRISPR-associated protein Csd1